MSTCLCLASPSSRCPHHGEHPHRVHGKPWPPLAHGTRVAILCVPDRKNERGLSEFDSRAVDARLPRAMGTIVSHSDSHGLIYLVEHFIGGKAYYEPDELTVVS